MEKRYMKLSIGCIMAVAMLSLIFSIEAVAESNVVFLTATESNAVISSEATSSNADDSSVNENIGTDFSVSKEIENESILTKEASDYIESVGGVFDFILDPYGLVEKTDAVRYGGGLVEDGATLLFYNESGKYDFSSESDQIRIEVQEPSEIVVSACISEFGELVITEDSDFLNGDDCQIYLALIDDQGNEQPLSEDEEAVISLFLEPGSYSFGLTGACNPDADWEDVSVSPKVIVKWYVESARIEDEDVILIEDEEMEDDNSQESGIEEVNLDDTILEEVSDECEELEIFINEKENNSSEMNESEIFESFVEEKNELETDISEEENLESDESEQSNEESDFSLDIEE